MTPPQDLKNIIETFGDWQRPWEFHRYVVSIARGLSTAERETFEVAWQEALDARHWKSADIGQCAQVAETALRARFPDLTEAAAAAIARAASDGRR